MRVALSASDAFHWLLDRAIRRAGGPGNAGQLRLRLDRPLAARDALARACARLGELAPPLAGRARVGPLRAWWSVRGAARLGFAASPLGRDDLAAAELRRGFDPLARERLRIALADDPREPGLVVTWDHALLDARAVHGLLAALPALAGGGGLDEPWWRPGYRDAAAMPAAATRGRLARRSLEFVGPLRRCRLMTPLPRAAPAAPLVVRARCLGAGTAACDARMRAAAGRFGETPFLLACVAAALEECFGRGGDLVFPLAADLRPPHHPRRLANAHGFLMLRVPEGLASADLAACARHLRDEHRRWVAEDGVLSVLGALSWLPLVGERLGLAELGAGRGGVAASCIVANLGRVALADGLFGAAVLGVDHAVSVPGRPGLAALFHRDRRGLGFSVVATAAVARRVAPDAFADALAAQLGERPLGSVAVGA